MQILVGGLGTSPTRAIQEVFAAITTGAQGNPGGKELE